MDENTPFYEARVSIPALQYKIHQFIQQQVPVLEEELIRKVIKEAFTDSEVLRSYIDYEVREAVKEKAKQITRELINAEFRTEIEDRVRELIIGEMLT